MLAFLIETSGALRDALVCFNVFLLFSIPCMTVYVFMYFRQVYMFVSAPASKMYVRVCLCMWNQFWEMIIASRFCV